MENKLNVQCRCGGSGVRAVQDGPDDFILEECECASKCECKTYSVDEIIAHLEKNGKVPPLTYYEN